MKSGKLFHFAEISHELFGARLIKGDLEQRIAAHFLGMHNHALAEHLMQHLIADRIGRAGFDSGLLVTAEFGTEARAVRL